MFVLRNIYLLAVVILFLSACKSTATLEQNQEATRAIDGKYDSEFPNLSLAKDLNFVSKTVKKLDCLVFYESYVFPEESNLDITDLDYNSIENNSIARTITNESVTGTATVIYYDTRRVGLLTCAHVVDFPDTLITRYDNGDGPIQTLSVKLRQQTYVRDLPDGDDIEILLMDEKNDIALLGKYLDKHGNNRPVVLDYPVGNTKDLEWGSIVYVMGYPLGQLMVTRAIVSNPDNAGRGRFMTDALYNRGISGSPVLAIRDGVPNFELVGMATSTSVKRIYYLKPGKDDPQFINPEDIYTDELYVDNHKAINYGITYNVSIEEVIKLLNKNSKILMDKGFDRSLFFD